MKKTNCLKQPLTTLSYNDKTASKKLTITPTNIRQLNKLLEIGQKISNGTPSV